MSNTSVSNVVPRVQTTIPIEKVTEMMDASSGILSDILSGFGVWNKSEADQFAQNKLTDAAKAADAGNSLPKGDQLAVDLIVPMATVALDIAQKFKSIESGNFSTDSGIIDIPIEIQNAISQDKNKFTNFTRTNKGMLLGLLKMASKVISINAEKAAQLIEDYAPIIIGGIGTLSTVAIASSVPPPYGPIAVAGVTLMGLKYLAMSKLSSMGLRGAARMLGGAIYDTMMDGGCGCTGGVSGGGLRRKLNIKGGAVGDNDVIAQYSDSANRAAKDSIVDNIISAMSALGFKVSASGSRADKVAEIIKMLPSAKDIKNKDAGTQANTCKKIAAAINTAFATEIFNTNVDPVLLCQGVAEVLHSLASEVHSEFLVVIRNVRILLDNMIHIKEYLDQAFEMAMRSLEASDAKRGDAIKAKEVHKLLTDKLEQQILVLKNLFSTSISGTEAAISGLIGDETALKSYIEKIDTKLGTGEFSDVIITMLRGMGITAQYAQVVNEALKTIGMTMKEFGEATTYSDIAAKASDLLSKKDLGDRELNEYMKAVQLVYTNLPNAKKIAEALGTKGGSIYEGGKRRGGSSLLGTDEGEYEKTALDRRVENTEKLKNMIINTFYRQIATLFANIVTSLNELGKQIGKAVPLSEQLDGFRNAMGKISTTFVMHRGIYWALIGYYNDALSKSKKDTLMAELRIILVYLDELMAMPLYKDAAKQYFRAIHNNITALISTIDKYSDEIAAKFGSSSRFGGRVGGAGASLFGDPEVPPAMKAPVESVKFALGLGEAFRNFDFFYRAAQIKSNMSRTSAEFDSYSVGYKELTAKSIAAKIEDVNSSYTRDMKYLESLISSNSDVYGNADQTKKEVEAAKQFMEAQYAARKKFWTTLEAVDTYMQLFTNGIIKNPDDIRDIRNMINDVEIINEWYTDASGDKITNVFDSFPARIVGNNIAITDSTTATTGAIMPPATYKTGQGHYYSRIENELKTATNPLSALPGNPYIATDPTRGTEAVRTLGSALRGINALKNLMSVFVNLGSKFGGADINKAVFMKPAVMYKNMVEFLTFSSFSQGMATSERDRSSVMTVLDAMENLDQAGIGHNSDIGELHDTYLSHRRGDGSYMYSTRAQDKPFLDKITTIIKSRSTSVDKKIQQIASIFVIDSNIKTAAAFLKPETATLEAIYTDLRATPDNISKYRTLDQLVNVLNNLKLNEAKFHSLREWLEHLESLWDRNIRGSRLLNVSYDFNSGTVTANRAQHGIDNLSHGTIRVGVLADSEEMNNIAAFRSRFGILMRAKTGEKFDKDRLLSGNFEDEDEYFVLLLKSMAAKIFTVIGVYDLLDKPNEVTGLTPTRMIVGGSDATPKVNPALTELYFRLPLLAQFYRNLFGFDNEENWGVYTDIKKKDTTMKISMVPEIDGVFSGLINIIFRKTIHINNNAYSDDDIKDIVGEVNAIHAKLAPKYPNDTTREIINQFVAEVNRRYGVITRTQRKAIEDQMSKRLNYTLEGVSGIGEDRYSGLVDNINYPILPGEGEYDDEVPTIAPSDAYLSSKMENIKGRKSPYGITTEHYKLLRRFRCLIDNYFKDAKNDVTFTTSIKSTQQRMEGQQSDDEKIKMIGSLIRGVDAFSRADNIKYLMFHENVVAGLNTLSAIHTILARFRNNILAMSIDDVFPVMMDALAKWYGLNGKKGVAAFNMTGGTGPRDFVKCVLQDYNEKFGGVVIDEVTFSDTLGVNESASYRSGIIGDEYQIPTLHGVTEKVIRFGGERDGNNDIADRVLHNIFNRIPAADIAKHRTTTNDDFKKRMEMFKWHVFPKEHIMKLLIENIYLVTRDMQGLTSMRIDGDNIVVNFGGLRKVVTEMFADITANINLMRPHVNPDIITRYTDKFRAGSLYWLHEQINEKLFEGRKSHDPKVKEYVSLDKLGVKITNLFKYLTSSSVYTTNGLNNNPVSVSTGTSYKHKYGNVLADLVFYDSRKASSGIYNSTDARCVTDHKLNDEPQLIDFMGRNDPIEQLICVGFLDKRALDTRYLARYRQLYSWNSEMNHNRSLLFDFNQLIAKYLHTCFDGAAQKVYSGAINAFVSGTFNHGIMNQEHTWPDTWPGYMVKPGKGRWTADTIANELYHTIISEGGPLGVVSVGGGSLTEYIKKSITDVADLDDVINQVNSVYTIHNFAGLLNNLNEIIKYEFDPAIWNLDNSEDINNAWSIEALGMGYNGSDPVWYIDYIEAVGHLYNIEHLGTANALNVNTGVNENMTNAFNLLLSFCEYAKRGVNAIDFNYVDSWSAATEEHKDVIMACLSIRNKSDTRAYIAQTLETIFIKYRADYAVVEDLRNAELATFNWSSDLAIAVDYINNSIINRSAPEHAIRIRSVAPLTPFIYQDDLSTTESGLRPHIRMALELQGPAETKWVNNILEIDTTILMNLVVYIMVRRAINNGELALYINFMKTRTSSTGRYSIDVQTALIVCALVVNYKASIMGTRVKLIGDLARITDKRHAPDEGEPTKDTTSVMIPSSELLSGLNLDIWKSEFPPFDSGSLRLCSEKSGIPNLDNTFELHKRMTTKNNYAWGKDDVRASIGHLFDTDPDKLLFTSLSVLFKNIIATKNMHSQPAYMYENIGDVPQYVKERYRGNMPAFRSMFKSLIARAEHMRQFIENKHVNTERDYTISGGTDLRTRNLWPGTGLKNAATTDAATREMLSRICNNIIKGCTTLVTCCEQVMRDLADEPKFFETQLNGIKEYRQYNNTDPLMPLSSIIASFNDTSIFKTSFTPFHELGTDEFKYMYGTRRILFQPDANVTLADAPGYQAIVNDYNAGTKGGKFAVAENKMGSYFNNFIRLARYINEYTNMKRVLSKFGGLHEPSDTVTYANTIRLVRDLEPNEVPTNTAIYSLFSNADNTSKTANIPVKPVIQLNTEVGLSGTISITESTNKNDMIKNIVSYITDVDAAPTKMDVQNIIDMNIVPINVHAMMRELPLANLYNYAYTYDRMIVDLYYGDGTKNANKIINELCQNDGDIDIKSSRDLMLSLMLKPYRDVSHREYNNYLRALMIGDSSVELGRPKFLSDQLYNKLLFGSMYESSQNYKEAGPHMERPHPHAVMFSMIMSILHAERKLPIIDAPNPEVFNQNSGAPKLYKALGGHSSGAPDVHATRMFVAMAMNMAIMAYTKKTSKYEYAPFGTVLSLAIHQMARLYVPGAPKGGFGYDLGANPDPLRGRTIKGTYNNGGARAGYYTTVQDLSTLTTVGLAEAIILGGDDDHSLNVMGVKLSDADYAKLEDDMNPMIHGLASALNSFKNTASPVFTQKSPGTPWVPRNYSLDNTHEADNLNISNMLTYLDDQKNILGQNKTDDSGMYPDNMRVYNTAQVREVSVGGLSHNLAVLGRLRFDTMFTRNMIFITNLYRSVRLKLNGELNYNREIVSRAREIVRPEITEFVNNQVYERLPDYAALKRQW